jgi:hypothetical protein
MTPNPTSGSSGTVLKVSCGSEADLIDEVGANLHPILLRQGTPLFHRMSKSQQLIQCEQIAHGFTYLLYRLLH